MKKVNLILGVIILLSMNTVGQNTFTLTSKDLGGQVIKAQEFDGFGCSGDNLSPHLKWSDAPKGTKSFAITAYDPDAPTSSGWWHWQLVNMPTTVTELPAGAGASKANMIPTGSTQITNDFGSSSFGGACPPEGHGVHHYRFTIHALSVEKLDLPEDASGALTSYMINAYTIESSTIESLYKRD